MRLQVFMAMKTHVLVFWVVTQCHDLEDQTWAFNFSLQFRKTLNCRNWSFIVMSMYIALFCLKTNIVIITTNNFFMLCSLGCLGCESQWNIHPGCSVPSAGWSRIKFHQICFITRHISGIARELLVLCEILTTYIDCYMKYDRTTSLKDEHKCWCT